MRYLADTHVLIWAWQEPERLSTKARAILENGEETIFFSVASLWEVAIKVALNKLRLHVDIQEFAAAQIEDALQPLPIRIAHAARVAGLAFHHRDPFDRMLIAQALEEDLELISADPVFDKYPIGRAW